MRLMQINRCGNGGGSTAASRRGAVPIAVKLEVDDRNARLVELSLFAGDMVRLKLVLLVRVGRRVGGVATTRRLFRVGSGTGLFASEHCGLCRSLCRSRVAAIAVNHRFAVGSKVEQGLSLRARCTRSGEIRDRKYRLGWQLESPIGMLFEEEKRSKMLWSD